MNNAFHESKPAIIAAASALLCVLVLAPSIGLGQQCNSTECAEVITPNHYDAACQALRPRWIARGSALYMDRITANSRVLMQNTTSTAQHLNANAFDFDWGTGFDASVMRKEWDDRALEIRYLDLGQLNARTTVDTNGGLVEIESTPPVSAANVQSIVSGYDTELFGFEVNYYFPVYEAVSVLAGFRYVSFDDRLTAVLDATPQTFLYNTATSNDLYGGQIGLATVPCQCLMNGLWVSSHIKLGIFGNEAENRSVIDTGATTLGVIESTGSTSFVGEIGGSLMLPITNHISIIGGYNMLYLQDVAIASDQIAASDFFNGTGSNDQGHAIFHGASLAIQLRH